MKRAIEITFMASVMLGIIGFIVYLISSLIGWKFAVAWVVLLGVLSIWIAKDIHNCATMDEQGNIIVPTKEDKCKSEMQQDNFDNV